MTKNIFKEIVIVLLLCLAIILLLGVILYDYVPTNKIVPEEITYSTSKEVKDELKSADEADADKVILTYTLDQTDLNNYQSINDYRPGKTNPFSTYKTQNATKPSSDGSSTGNTTGGTSGNSTGNSSSNTSSSSNTPIAPGEVNPGNYTNNKGLK